MNPVLGLVGQLKMSAHPKSEKLVLICSKNPIDIYLSSQIQTKVSKTLLHLLEDGL